MSDAYETDMAQERAIYDRIAAAEAQTGPEAPVDKGGRPYKADPIKVIAWRQAHSASIRDTAKRWRVSEASVKRWTKTCGEAAKLERQRYEQDRLDRELREHEYGYRMMFLQQRNAHLFFVGLDWHGKESAGRDEAMADADRMFREDWQRCMGPIPD